MTFSYFFDFWNKIIGEKSRKFAADMPFSRIIAFILVLSVIIPAEFSAYAAERKADFTVAIDPGHGGRDAGCRSKRQKEKDIVLDVATQLQTLIAKNCKDSVKVVMTRDDDTFIPLMDRAKIANNAEADLFISIHVNSLDRRARNTFLTFRVLLAKVAITWPWNGSMKQARNMNSLTLPLSTVMPGAVAEGAM